MNRRGVGAAALVLLLTGEARAAGSRPRFEPTDLQLENPGVTELDLQTGVLYGDGPAGLRLSLVDFELDLGLLPRVELDLDGAFALNNLETSTPAVTGESLWTAVKLGFLDSRSAAGTSAFSLGAQLGPRIATVGEYGAGDEGLALLGLYKDRTHVVLNGGGILDPGPARGTVRPLGIVGGVDLDLDLDAKNRWSLLAELGVGYFLRAYPAEVTVTAGFGFSPNKSLAFSLILLGGLVPGGDRLGLLFGVAPKTSLW